ncbi:ketosteroid isomerase-related protein [Thioclava sp. GXIMD4216]|uniref:ketosteroid isomerase-related protein n=1 Tax=Thioclava sp. GXIMD4216 TaxID=3131929 RepID=UPI0030CB0CBF
MSRLEALETLKTYYDAFNAGDTAAMEALLADDFEHHVNEGNIRRGAEAFREFNAHMTQCYRETLTDLCVMANEAGTRAAAEFIVNGTYLKTDEGLPDAKGQNYRLPAGTFFDLKDGKIARVTTYYNLSDWIKQVS